MNTLQKILTSLAFATTVMGCSYSGKYNSGNIARESTTKEIQTKTLSLIDAIVFDKQITPQEINKLGDQYQIIKSKLQQLDFNESKNSSEMMSLESQKAFIEKIFDSYMENARESFFIDVIIQYNKQGRKLVTRGTDDPFNHESNRARGWETKKVVAYAGFLGIDKYDLISRISPEFQRNTGSHSQLYNTSVIVDPTMYKNLIPLVEKHGSLVNDTKNYDSERIKQLWNNKLSDGEFDTLALKLQSPHIQKLD